MIRVLGEEEAIRKVVELKKKYNEDYLLAIAGARLEVKESLRKKYQPMIDKLLVEDAT